MFLLFKISIMMKDSRRQSAQYLALVSLDHVQTVNVEHLVRVDGHEDAPSVSLEHQTRAINNAGSY
jgi:hypothetical protein